HFATRRSSDLPRVLYQADQPSRQRKEWQSRAQACACHRAPSPIVFEQSEADDSRNEPHVNCKKGRRAGLARTGLLELCGATVSNFLVSAETSTRNRHSKLPASPSLESSRIAPGFELPVA